MANTNLPEEVQKELDNAATTYSFHIRTQQYPIALEIVSALYNKMLGWQTHYEMRLHKGYPLHSIGYILNCQKRPEALKYFILAYIEDLLSADTEDEAGLLPAGQTLLLNRYQPEILKILVAKAKNKGSIPFVPEEVLGAFGKSWHDVKGKITVKDRGRCLKKSPKFDSNSKKKSRVFIGGSGKLRPVIDYMRNMVVRLGYHPVVALDYEVPEELDIHRKCIILLRTCKYGIFDLSEETGQLIEIDTLHEYDIETLLIWPKGKEEDVAKMLNGFKDHAVSYETFAEMENIFCNFLPQKVSS